MLTRSLCPSCSPEVLATPTADLGKILSAMHKASIGGESDLYTGIQIAQVRRCSNLCPSVSSAPDRWRPLLHGFLQLALKHRQNKTQRQRLIILVGSPLSASQDEKALVRLGKKLKKNNVAVDVVTFASEPSEAAGAAEDENNEPALIKFVESVNSGENSCVSPRTRVALECPASRMLTLPARLSCH
jgi:26S proteasome regulatory subunit N10